MLKNRVPLNRQGRIMSSINTISIDKLARLIGTPHCPALVDVRTEDDFNANPRLIPSAMRRPHADPSDWAQEFAGRSAIVICQKGAKLSQGVAAWLRHAGVPADGLEDGFEGWRKADLPTVPTAKMPPLDKQRTHGLGHARTAEGRSHRLPLADPPLRRSARGVPVRRSRGGATPSPSASPPRRSTSRACSGATAARPARST